MPIGNQQINNFLHSTLDVWNGHVFFTRKHILPDTLPLLRQYEPFSLNDWGMSSV